MSGKKIAYDVAVEQFGYDWAEEHVKSGQVEPSPDQKKYGDYYPYVLKARAQCADIAEEMNAEGMPGEFRLQLMGITPQQSAD